MDAKSFSDRLTTLRIERRLSGRAFAKAAGLKASTYQALTTGRSPTLDTLVTISRSLDVDVRWLATGEGARSPDPQFSAPNFQGVHETFHLGDDIAMVPRLEVQASAGPGTLVEHEDAIGVMAFEATWLRRKGIDPTAARALTVRGDSMEPTIRSGDVLLVDTSKRRVEDNGIYVVVSGGYVLVKRVHPRRDGSMMLISDNQAYPPEDVPSHEATDFSVAGRVMWFGRSI